MQGLSEICDGISSDTPRDGEEADQDDQFEALTFKTTPCPLEFVRLWTE